MERKCICRDNPRAAGLCVIGQAQASDELMASYIADQMIEIIPVLLLHLYR